MKTITALLLVGILASAMLSCGTEDSKIETVTTDMPTELSPHRRKPEFHSEFKRKTTAANPFGC